VQATTVSQAEETNCKGVFLSVIKEIRRLPSTAGCCLSDRAVSAAGIGRSGMGRYRDCGHEAAAWPGRRQAACAGLAAWLYCEGLVIAHDVVCVW